MTQRAATRCLLTLFLAGLAQAAGAARAQEPQTAGILRPSDRSVLQSGALQIIARTGEIWLDGKPIRQPQDRGGRQALSVSAPAGKHELLWKHAGGFQKIEFFVASGPTETPPGWKVYKEHPPQAECAACHAGEKDFRKSSIAETCFSCHEQKAFPAAHSHNSEVLAECVLCHDPHGSAERFHLRMTRETTCKQCHG